MRLSSFFLFSLIADFANGKATELNKDSFDTFISENEQTLVKFYAPWCGHCKKMAPAFDEAADILAGTAMLAKVDVNEELNKPLAEQYGVRGFPTLMYFNKGNRVEYTGGRETNDIVQWVTRMSGPALEMVKDREAVRAKAAEGNVLAYCGDIGPKSMELQKIQSIAENQRGLVTFVAFHCDVTKQPDLELHRKDGSYSKHPFDASNTEEEVVRFIRGESLGYFDPIGPENAMDYSQSGLDIIYFGGSVADYEKVKSFVTDIAKQFRGHYAFTFLDNEKYSRQAEGMLRTTVFPAFVFPLTGDAKGSYKVDDDANFNEAYITQWVKDIKDGKLKPEMMSEPIPETNNDPVKVIVGKNWADIVQDDKDVMVEIYAPWCGHCKAFAPDYDSAAEKLAVLAPDAILAKIDGTANDIPVDGYSFTGFPTIYFKKAGKSPVKYEGGRDADSVIAYFQSHGSATFTHEPQPKADDDKDEL